MEKNKKADNVLDFRKTTFWGVAASISACPDSDKPEVVLSGKSNVGKSSLLNALGDNKKLARVSQSPGKTRQVVYFEVDGKFYIADLPGYGYAKAPKQEKEKFSKLVDQYFASGRPISLILHLLDIRHLPSKEDMGMISYMLSNAMPFFIVFTKCDKLSRSQMLTNARDILKYLQIGDIPSFCVSADKKAGLDDLREAIVGRIFPS